MEQGAENPTAGQQAAGETKLTETELSATISELNLAKSQAKEADSRAKEAESRWVTLVAILVSIDLQKTLEIMNRIRDQVARKNPQQITGDFGYRCEIPESLAAGLVERCKAFESAKKEIDDIAVLALSPSV